MNHRTVESSGIKMHIAEDGEGPRFCLYIHHTGAEREFARAKD